MAGYVLKPGEGRSYLWSPFRYLFTIKGVGDEMHPDIAFIEFTTEKGQEPPRAYTQRRRRDLLRP